VSDDDFVYQKGRPMKDVPVSTRGISYEEWAQKLPRRAWIAASKPPAKAGPEARPEFGKRA
jgi:hypothetical protein